MKVIRNFIRLVKLGMDRVDWFWGVMVLVTFALSVAIEIIVEDNVLIIVASISASVMFWASVVLTFYITGVHRERNATELRYHNERLKKDLNAKG